MLFHALAIAVAAAFFMALQRIEPVSKRALFRAVKLVAAGLIIGLVIGAISLGANMRIEKQATSYSVAEVATTAVTVVATVTTGTEVPVPFWYPAFVINLFSILVMASMGALLARFYVRFVKPYRSRLSFRLDWKAAALFDRKMWKLKPRDRDVFVLLVLPASMTSLFLFARIGLAAVSAPALVFPMLPMLIMEAFAGAYAAAMAFHVFERWLSSGKIALRETLKKAAVLALLVLIDVLVENLVLCSGISACLF
jgi:hypothetical protein